MPEFQRLWKEWAEENFGGVARYAPDKTDKSPSVSFVSSIAPLSPENLSTDHLEDSPDSCLFPACHFHGRVVDLGGDLATRLCATHRRKLYRRARELADTAETDVSPIFDAQACRFCGRIGAPEDDPCLRCVAASSPLVQLAVGLGARALCACGAVVDHPGDRCEPCRDGQRA